MGFVLIELAALISGALLGWFVVGPFIFGR